MKLRIVLRDKVRESYKSLQLRILAEFLAGSVTKKVLHTKPFSLRKHAALNTTAVSL